MALASRRFLRWRCSYNSGRGEGGRGGWEEVAKEEERKRAMAGGDENQMFPFVRLLT